MCRTARITFSTEAFFSRRDSSIARARFAEVILTVTGVASPASRMRISVQVVLSNSNGSSAHHPWLMTVRRKLKSRGVGIVTFIMAFQNNEIAKKRWKVGCTHQL